MSAEWNKEELEWLKGTYLHPETVERVFRLPQGTLHQPMGVHACQPFERSKGTKTNILLGMGFAALFALLLFYSFGKSGTLVGRYTISPDDYLSQDGFLSAPFKIADGDHNFRIVTRAPVRGRWVASSIGFVDEKDNVLMNVDQTMEQYSGYEGGEYWSEGSGSDSALFRMSGGQSYRLIAFGESASWPRVGSGNAPPFYVEIYQDVIPKRYFAMALVLALILPALEIWRRERFRAAKWGDDEEDD